MGELFFLLLLILSATFYSLVFEYFVHKYILHNYRYFKLAFKNHFKVHHKTSRSNKMYDPGYKGIISSHFEIASLTIIAAIHLPLFILSPVFYFVLIANLIHYYYCHRKSHTDTAWGRKNLPWHYAHHMGKDQNINWGVRSPIVDKIMGTSLY